jgi:excinuclease ABC subunit C
MMEAAADERFEQAAQLRDAIRTVETLRDRQQKMATPELGDRDAFGVKVGPGGAVVQVFQVRGGRVVERIELADRGHGRAAAGEADVLAGGAPAVLRGPARRPRSTCRSTRDEDEALEAWLSERAGRRVRLVVPQRGDKRGLLDLAAQRRARLPGALQRGPPRTTTRSRRCARCSRCRAAARIECFDISTIQGSETVASMVVCEDGRMKRGEYRKFRDHGRRSRWRREPATRAGESESASR